MLIGDCNVCVNGKLPSYSATCVECGLSRKNFKPITNADRTRAMTDEELADWVCDRACSLCPIEDCEGRMEVGRVACRKKWLYWLKQEVE